MSRRILTFRGLSSVTEIFQSSKVAPYPAARFETIFRRSRNSARSETGRNRIGIGRCFDIAAITLYPRVASLVGLLQLSDNPIRMYRHLDHFDHFLYRAQWNSWTFRIVDSRTSRSMGRTRKTLADRFLAEGRTRLGKPDMFPELKRPTSRRYHLPMEIGNLQGTLRPQSRFFQYRVLTRSFRGVSPVSLARPFIRILPGRPVASLISKSVEPASQSFAFVSLARD